MFILYRLSSTGSPELAFVLTGALKMPLAPEPFSGVVSAQSTNFAPLRFHSVAESITIFVASVAGSTVSVP